MITEEMLRSRRKGKVTVTVRSVVSKDGKMLTYSVDGVNEKGEIFTKLLAAVQKGATFGGLTGYQCGPELETETLRPSPPGCRGLFPARIREQPV